MNFKRYTHLKQLESESIHIIREVIAEFKNPVMLYSIGKDSSVMLHLSRKAFYPGKIRFPLLHIDTGWKFNEIYKFRKKTSKNYNIELLIYKNKNNNINNNINPFINGSKNYTNIMKTMSLKKAINKYNFDAVFGGARRDEEKSRAKERIYSFRNRHNHWNPKNQRPELWRNYNGKINKKENIRVFPLSNWTELDIWEYIYLENIEIIPLYFSKNRRIINRDNVLIMIDDNRINLKSKEIPMNLNVRFRTLGCWPFTSATKSNAKNLSNIIEEILILNSSERYGRTIDIDQVGSMEYKKRNGYF
ncbi:MAG: sulfate adenylyltransferase subunit CysD [Enterobacteriaceae bacterium]